MIKNIDYFEKYYKYKNKYNMLKNQYSGAHVSSDIDYLDELSFNTQLLVTTDRFMKLEWNNYQQFEDLVNSFGVEIINIKDVVEWGQDFISKIKLSDGHKQIFIHSRYFTEEAQTQMTDVLPNITFKKIGDIPENTNIYNLGKGGNFISLPNKINGRKAITLKQEAELSQPFCKLGTLLCLKIYLPGFNIDDHYDGDVFHLDEILTLIPTGPGVEDYNVWFYNPICSEDEEYNRALQDIFLYNYTKLQELFPIERIKLFNLHFTRDGKLKFPPIFNRVLLRRGKMFRIIFPDQIILELKQQVIDEMENVIQTYPHIEYYFINTDQLHMEQGNIHCGFKSIPNI
jgi:hypothetical protein